MLAPGGVAVFQIPSDHAADDPPTGAPRTVGTTAIAPAERKARLRCDDPVDPVSAGKALILSVTVTNDGAVPWPALGGFDSGFAVTQVAVGSTRADPPCRKPRCPCRTLSRSDESLFLGIGAPYTNGEQYLSSMFEEHGPGSRTRLAAAPYSFRGEGGIPAPSRSSVLLQRRYPAVRRPLRTAGAGAVRAWLDRCLMMSRRQARYLRNAWRRRTATTPIMEMHCVPRGDVEAVVSAAQRRVVDIDTDILEGGFRSRVYWVVRPAVEPGA